MTSSLPVDIDSSYPDRSAGDAAHQQHHDVLHALNNVVAAAPEDSLFVKSGGVLVPLSRDTYLQGTLVGEASGAAASYTFSGIPATYDSLVVELIGRSDAAVAATTLLFRANGDAGLNYDTRRLFDSTALESIGGSGWICGTVPGASATANKPGMTRLTIPRYADTTFHKFGYYEGGRTTAEASGGIGVEHGAFAWRNTAAITELLLRPNSGSFVAGTVAKLYGIGAA